MGFAYLQKQNGLVGYLPGGQRLRRLLSLDRRLLEHQVLTMTGPPCARKTAHLSTASFVNCREWVEGVHTAIRLIESVDHSQYDSHSTSWSCGSNSFVWIRVKARWWPGGCGGLGGCGGHGDMARQHTAWPHRQAASDG